MKAVKNGKITEADLDARLDELLELGALHPRGSGESPPYL